MNFNFLEVFRKPKILGYEDFVDIFWRRSGGGITSLDIFFFFFFFFLGGGVGGCYLVNCILGSFCKFKVQNGNTFLLNAKIVSILEALTEDAGFLLQKKKGSPPQTQPHSR